MYIGKKLSFLIRRIVSLFVGIWLVSCAGPSSEEVVNIDLLIDGLYMNNDLLIPLDSVLAQTSTSIPLLMNKLQNNKKENSTKRVTFNALNSITFGAIFPVVQTLHEAGYLQIDFKGAIFGKEDRKVIPIMAPLKSI